MKMKIAVLVNGEEQTIGFDESGIVKLYQRMRGGWKVKKEIVFGIHNAAGIHEIRDKIRKMVGELGDCRVFAATEVTGVPYAILEGLGFEIWKMQGAPLGFLDYIAQQEQEQQGMAVKPTSIPAPVPMQQVGCYYLDLKTVLDSDSTLTSKQVLLPFLKNTAFEELELLCDHVPLWFEKEFPDLKLTAAVEPVEGDVCRVKVRAAVDGLDR